jgi:hypothetical protein
MGRVVNNESLWAHANRFFGMGYSYEKHLVSIESVLNASNTIATQLGTKNHDFLYHTNGSPFLVAKV